MSSHALVAGEAPDRRPCARESTWRRRPRSPATPWKFRVGIDARPGRHVVA
jgi:hypothetical protein